ncbi:hypothetical protein [Streptomyces hebeiensis]
MTDIVVVLRAEDAVLDFLSVLTDAHAGETRVILGDRAEILVLPAGAGADERLALLGRHVGPAANGAASPGPEVLAGLLRACGAGPGGSPGAADGPRVWTHSPADNRPGRRRLGRDTSVARAALDGTAPDGVPGDTFAPTALTARGGRGVRHAVGYSPYLQFLSDLDRPLDAARVAAKLDFVNRWCGPLLAEREAEFALGTARVPATERFFDASADERDRLFALLASLDDGAAAVEDPWEFATSPYERGRLDATAAWIGEHLDPADGPLVEVGACEGALTGRLAAAGFTVRATEPNPVFRPRLATALAGTASVTVDDADLARLAKEDAPPRAAAHLLIEMLYYDQDLALLDSLPTGLLFVSLEPEALDLRLLPWLERSATWRVAEQRVLVPPRVETVCAGRAYLSKRGSVGVLLRRAPD